MLLSIVALLLGVQARPPTSLTGHTGAMIGDRFFVVGGMDERESHQFVRSMWEFDLKNEKWTQRTAMKTARAMAASATVGSSIYVAGGMQQTGEYLRSVERYDTLTRRWVEVAPMRVARTRFAMVNCNGHLFAIGGLSGKSDRAEVFNADTVEEYDPKTNKWSEAGRLQVGRHGFAACVAENRVYILGGYVGSSSTLSSTCECFDPKQRVSRLIPSLPSARGFHAAVATGRGHRLLWWPPARRTSLPVRSDGQALDRSRPT